MFARLGRVLKIKTCSAAAGNAVISRFRGHPMTFPTLPSFGELFLVDQPETKAKKGESASRHHTKFAGGVILTCAALGNNLKIRANCFRLKWFLQVVLMILLLQVSSGNLMRIPMIFVCPATTNCKLVCPISDHACNSHLFHLSTHNPKNHRKQSATHDV